MISAMESKIWVRATVPEMRAFFDQGASIKYMKIQDSRYTKAELDTMPYEQYNSTKFKFLVIYRHSELVGALRGTFTIEGLKKKLKNAGC